MSLLGLLLCGLGLGYAVHKDNQKFANMNREAVQLYGRGINEPFDDESLQNKYFWEIKKYFDERYDYYINNRDYISNHTDIENGFDFRVVKPEELDKLQQYYAGFLAYDDMFRKYAPDYVKWFCDPLDTYTSNNTPYNQVSFSNIARALARKEAYRLGFLPAHMANMNCKLGGKTLYFYTGCGNVCQHGPTAYDSVDWEKEAIKYNHWSNKIKRVCERK